MFTDTNDEYTDTTTRSDGVSLTVRSYKDGRRPEYFTYDINGNLANNGNGVVNDLLSNIKSDNLQCGEAVNKYVQGQLGIPRTEFHM